jgi:hypothetical protein
MTVTLRTAAPKMPADAHLAPPPNPGHYTIAQCDVILRRIVCQVPGTFVHGRQNPAACRRRRIADAWLDERLNASTHEKGAP